MTAIDEERFKEICCNYCKKTAVFDYATFKPIIQYSKWKCYYEFNKLSRSLKLQVYCPECYERKQTLDVYN